MATPARRRRHDADAGASPPPTPAATPHSRSLAGHRDVEGGARRLGALQRLSVCVHNGRDGNCGTSASGSRAARPSAIAAPYKGAVRARADAPSLGSRTAMSTPAARPRGCSRDVQVPAHSAVSSRAPRAAARRQRALLRLRRRPRALRESRCGSGKPFTVGGARVFCYLLPASSPAGRYVFDIKASDAAGNTTTLVRGTIDVVFCVH